MKLYDKQVCFIVKDTNMHVKTTSPISAFNYIAIHPNAQGQILLGNSAYPMSEAIVLDIAAASERGDLYQVLELVRNATSDNPANS